MLERLVQEVSPYLQARRWFVAYSGGLDSHVLLHTLAALKRQNPHFPQLLAIHVNHQIQVFANEWQLHCHQQCELLGIECLSYRVDVDNAHNIEENARKARYQVFANLLHEDDCIFFAHHQQDQLETFLYRLFRGAGIKGLLAMASSRKLGKGVLARPFLSVMHDDLQRYAEDHHLHYIKDPSNTDISFDRNYIRHRLLPVIKIRWPAFGVVIQRTIAHFQSLDGLLDEIAREDLQGVDVRNSPEPSISLERILAYSASRQNNLLRYWLLQHEIILSARQTEELFASVIHAGEDANPLLQAGDVSLRRYQSRLYIAPGEEGLPGYNEIHWHGLLPCDVPGYGIIALSKPLDIHLLVRPRHGGESIKPLDSSHKRKLKTLLQEMKVAPWRRAFIPLVYYNDELIAIADLVQAETATLQGIQIVRVETGSGQ